MKPQRDWIRRLGALVVILASLFPVTLVQPTSGKALADGAFELFYSNQTGYFFFWNPETWSIEEEISDPGIDSIHLTDGEVIVAFSAFLAPDVTPVECVQMVLDALAADSSTVDMVALTAEGGSPEITESDSLLIDEQVSDIVLMVNDGGDQQKFAVRIECGAVIPGESLRLKTVIVSAQVYNLFSWKIDRDLEIPAFEVFYYPHQYNKPVSIPGETGEDTGIFVVGDTCPFTNVFVLARGARKNASFIIDPKSFTAFDVWDGGSLPVTVVWSLPEAPRDTPLFLGSGEIGLFQILAEGGQFHLFYTPTSGETVQVGTFGGGCGAGALRLCSSTLNEMATDHKVIIVAEVPLEFTWAMCN